MSDLTIQQLLFRFAAFVLVAPVHGLALAAAARWRGDPGPWRDGRLSVNPVPHLDVVGTVTATLFSIGWIRPMPLDVGRHRARRIDAVIVPALALAVNLVFALAVLALRPAITAAVPGEASASALLLVNAVVRANIWFVAVNVLPLPPFSAGLTWLAFPRLTLPRYETIAKYAGVGILVLAVAVDLQRAVRPWANWLGSLVGLS